jgi:ATP-dependent helicase/nuclease subunit A
VPFAFKQDGTIVEGKIDVVFREGDGLCIVDFKTDRISKQDVKARAEQYRPQAAAYAAAIEAAAGVKPQEIIFYFVAIGEAVTLTP